MNGDSTGLEPTDSGGEGDFRRLRRCREALGHFQETAKAACDLGEHKLQREAEDATARVIAQIQRLEEAAREGLRRSEALHGQNPQDAEVMQGL